MAQIHHPALRREASWTGLPRCECLEQDQCSSATKQLFSSSFLLQIDAFPFFIVMPLLVGNPDVPRTGRRCGEEITRRLATHLNSTQPAARRNSAI